MPDAFFASSKKRKRPSTSKHTSKSTSNAKPGRPSKKKKRDEELSDEDGEGGVDDMDLRADALSDEEVDEETPAEKRLRLAQIYLDSIKSNLAEGEYDAAEIDRELISSRLRQDVLEHEGKVHLFIADTLNYTNPRTLRTTAHRFSVTSAVATENLKYLFTAGKEGHIFKWDLKTGKRLSAMYKLKPPPSSTTAKGKSKALAPPDPTLPGHTSSVLTLAISGDDRLLVSGGPDRRLCLWDVETGEWKKTFAGHLGHKDAITHLSFRKATSQLYTASLDRTVKVYDLSPAVMGYVETLFGHQDSIPALDALRGDTCVTVGARDRTARFWKIVEETQLVFRGGGRSRVREMLEGGLRADDEGDGEEETERKAKEKKNAGYVESSLECIAMIDESTFVTGGDSGSISLWTTTKKKPIYTHPLAHGLSETPSESLGEMLRTPRWITALGALRYSDLFASGSYDSTIRLWKLDPKLKSFGPLSTIRAPGVVNSLQLLRVPSGGAEAGVGFGSSWRDSGIADEETQTQTQTQTLGTQTDTQTLASSQSQSQPKTRSQLQSQSQLHSQPHPASTKPSRPSVLLTAALGQEHRLGRWLSVKEGRNGGLVVVFEGAGGRTS